MAQFIPEEDTPEEGGNPTPAAPKARLTFSKSRGLKPGSVKTTAPTALASARAQQILDHPAQMTAPASPALAPVLGAPLTSENAGRPSFLTELDRPEIHVGDPVGAQASEELRSVLQNLREQSLNQAARGQTHSVQIATRLFDSIAAPGAGELETLIAKAESMEPSRLASDQRRKEKFICLGAAFVAFALVMLPISVAFHWAEVTRWCMRAVLLLPICLFYGADLACRKLSRHSPALAKKVMFFTMMGNPVSTLTIARFHYDGGNIAEAGKILIGANKKIRPNKLGPYITGHAFLAAAKARLGKVQEASALILQVFELAKANFESVSNPVSGSLYATTLLYAVEVSDQRNNREECLGLSTLALEVLCKQKTPPPELFLEALSKVGYYLNLQRRSEEAVAFLEKANRTARALPDCKDSQVALILTSLGVAQMEVGSRETAEGYLKQALARASSVQGEASLYAVQIAVARLESVRGNIKNASNAYAAALIACNVVRPESNIFRVRLLNDYQSFAKQNGDDQQASRLELEATQLKYNLEQNDQLAKPGQATKVKSAAAAAIPKKTQRFPIFWTIFALWEVCRVWEGGLRMAPIGLWALAITAWMVLAIKLLAKYGRRCDGDESCAPLVAIAHAIPAARSVLVELGVLPKRTGLIVVGSAVALMAFVALTTPPPNTIPSWGYLPHEYMVLGQKFASEESFNKSREVFNRLVAMDPTGALGKKSAGYIRTLLPVAGQPEEAVEKNMKALSLSAVDKEAALKMWKELETAFPNFETPYIHVGQNLLASHRYKEAEEQLAKALAINPNSITALLQMGAVKSSTGDAKAFRDYSVKAMKASGEDGLTGAVSSWLLDSLEEAETARAAKTAKTAATVETKAVETKVAETKVAEKKTATTVETALTVQTKTTKTAETTEKNTSGSNQKRTK